MPTPLKQSQYSKPFSLCISCILFIIFCASATRNAAQKRTIQAPTVEQWGLEEIELHSSTPHKNPFQDVMLTATLSHGKDVFNVAGFYDGADTWRIRFMPQEQGVWRYTTHANDPALNDVTGAFSVMAPRLGNHGPVVVTHRYHFSYADGTPFFLIGTTMYNWINRDDKLQQQTLETLAHEPFNKVRFGIFPKWYAYNRVEPAYFPYIRNADKSFDLDRFDVRYFHQLEKRILQLQRLGIQADIILFHPYDHWGFDAMGAAHDVQYLRYVAARLSAYRNIWWTMANEYDLFSPSLTTFGSFTVEPRIPKDWDLLGNSLAASDPYHHLLGIHDIASWYDANVPWITHLLDQDGVHRPDLAVPIGRALYRKPVVVDEYGYEGNNGRGWGDLDARSLLKQHWELTIAGGYGSHGETYVHPGGILWWADGGTLVGDLPSRLGFLKQIMTEAPFQQMQPAPQQVMGGQALVGPEGYALFYFEKSGPVQVKLEGSALYRVDLIDPWLMKVYPLGLVPSGVHKLEIRMVPELLRFIPIKEGTSQASATSLRDRLEQFAGELPSPPPNTPFQPEQAHFSDQYTLNLILLNPAGREVLHRLLPDLKLDGINPALQLRTIADNLANHIDRKTYEEVKKELAGIQVY